MACYQSSTLEEDNEYIYAYLDDESPEANERASMKISVYDDCDIYASEGSTREMEEDEDIYTEIDYLYPQGQASRKSTETEHIYVDPRIGIYANLPQTLGPAHHDRMEMVHIYDLPKIGIYVKQPQVLAPVGHKRMRIKHIYDGPNKDIYTNLPQALKPALCFRQWCRDENYISNNYMNTAPMYIRTYGFPCSESLSSNTYNRRSGTVDMTGELFEVGIAMFLLLKGIFETAGFELATNVDWAGAFDDIIFKFKDKQKLTKHTYLLQLKHKSNRLIGHKLLCSDSGELSLLKYYDSYCQIKKEFSLHSDNNMFTDSFENCNFIIYTNTAFDPRDLYDLNVSYKNTQEILNTGGTNAQIISIHSKSKEYKIFSRLEEYRNLLQDITMNDLSYEENKLKLKKFQHLAHCKRLLSFKKDKFRKIVGEQLSEELDIEMWNQFLDQLQIYTQQASEEELESLIKQNIKIHCKTPDEVVEELYSKLKEAMIQWWRKGKYTLNENSLIFWHLLMEVHISAVLLPMSMKLSGISKLNFKANYQITSKMTHFVTNGCTELACLKIQQSLADVGHIMVDSFIMESHLTEILAVWEYGAWCNNLIIEGDSCSSESVIKLSTVLHSSPDKKLIIVGTAHNPIVKLLQQQFQIITYEDDFCLTQLDQESQNVVLESEVIFQDYSVTLKSLAKECIIYGAVTTDHVVTLLSVSQRLKLGQGLDEVDSCYISRILFRREYLDETIFSEHEHVKLAITGITKEKLKCLVRADEIAEVADAVNSSGGNSFHYFIINNADDFKTLSKIYDNIHWIEKNEDHFIWKCSEGDITLIKNYLKEDTASYDLLEIMSVCGQLVLIIAEPGMGKSTELCYLSYKLKQLYPAMWIVKVNLNDHTDYLSQNDPSPKELLLKAGGFNTLFERSLFIYQMFTGGNIVVMFDGFDEICPIYYDKIIDMLRSLSKTKIKNIWVTSRPVMGEKLEQQFSTLSFSFLHITENDQKTFLMKFWDIPDNSPYDLSVFISKLLKIPERFFDDKLKEFTGIPLQTKMLAEVFQVEALHYSETGEDKLPQKLNLLQLYNRFIDKKWDVYYKKLKVDITKVGLSEDHQEKKLISQQTHMICAVIALLQNDKIKQLKNSKTLLKDHEMFTEKFRKGHIKTGIIIDIVNGKPVFVHRTFAEYFLAMLFMENIVSGFNKNKNKFYNTIKKLFGTIELNEFYKKEIFFNFQITRTFLDMSLALRCRLHVAILNQDKALVENLVSGKEDINERDEGGRCPLHLAVTNFLNVLEDDESRTNAEQILLLLLNHGADVNVKDKIMRWRPLRLAVEIKAWTCVVFLLEKQVEMKDLAQVKQNIGDNKYIDSVLAEAGKQGSVKLASFVLKCGVNIEHRLDVGNSNMTQLHFAAKHGKLSLVQFLVENKANLEARDSKLRRTPLMWASEQGHVDVTEFLITKGARVDECDIDGNTAAHIAARRGQYEILKLLTQHGANMLVCNIYENTALHQAAGCGSVKCVSLLLKIIPDNVIDYRNNLQNTPLMTAARHGQCSVIEVLVKHGADLKVCDKEGNSVLHYAVEGGSVDCVKFLLDFGLQMNYTNHRNETTVWCAAHLGKLHIIKLLCERGAELNIQDNELDTPLHVAVRCGHIDVVKCLMQYKASFVSCGKWKTTPLHIAARLGHVKIAQYLVQHGASLNISTRIGGTPLHMAAKWGCLEMVECLLQHGASLQTFDYEGNTPLHIAVKMGHLKVVEYLTKSGANLTVCDHEGHTPLQGAAASGHLRVVEYLLNQGASLIDCDGKGHTALHMAAAWGHLHIIEFLIQNGGNAELFDYDGYTPLHVAVKWGHLNVVQWLIGHASDQSGITPLLNVCDQSGNTPLHIAAIWGHLHIVEWLIQHGASLTNNDNEGHTPLHVAIKADQLEVVQKLLQHHESVRPCEEEGHTPLHIAVELSKINIMKWLILAGAGLTDRDKEGKTPMHVAAAYGHLEILMYLLQQGVDLRECDAEGHELLHLAARNGHAQVVEYLIKLRANLTARNKWGSTPLHLAINWCHYRVIRCLILHGASLGITDKRGNTPLHIAARLGNLGIINFLLQNEPPITAKNNEGYTPLHIAVRWGHLDVIKLFKQHATNLTIYNNINNSLLITAATWGHLHVVRWLVQNEAVLTPNSKYFNLLLQVAVKWDHLEIVELCLKHRTSLSVCDDKGYTPLHMAAKCGHLEVSKTLVLHGASLTTYDEEGQMPVHVAIRWAQLHVVEMLVQFESGLTALTEDGFTLLHVAARWGHLHITEWLVKQGASLVARDKKGNTPLHIAATWGHVHIVKCFVQNDASSIACFNKAGCSPMQHTLEIMNSSEISEYQRNNLSSVVKFLSDVSQN